MTTAVLDPTALAPPEGWTCDYCDGPTDRTEDDNEYTDEITCEPCYEGEVQWQHEHEPGDCTTAECTRDHQWEAQMEAECAAYHAHKSGGS